jgi:hypothetical protein
MLFELFIKNETLRGVAISGNTISRDKFYHDSSCESVYIVAGDKRIGFLAKYSSSGLPRME